MDEIDIRIRTELAEIEKPNRFRRSIIVSTAIVLMVALEYAMTMIVYPIQGDLYAFCLAAGSTALGIILLSGIFDKLSEEEA